MTADISHLEDDVQEKLRLEAHNHRLFHTDKQFYYSDGDSRQVGRQEHWILKMQETEVPSIEDRETPYTWYYITRTPTNIPVESFESEVIRSIHLDKAEPLEEEDEHEWSITETNDFATEPVEELREYINEYDEEDE